MKSHIFLFCAITVLFSCSSTMQYNSANKNANYAPKGENAIVVDKNGLNLGKKKSPSYIDPDFIRIAYQNIGSLKLHTKSLADFEEALGKKGAEQGGQLVVVNRIFTQSTVDKRNIKQEFDITLVSKKVTYKKTVIEENTSYDIYCGVYVQKMPREDIEKVMEIVKVIKNSPESSVKAYLSKNQFYTSNKSDLLTDYYNKKAIERGSFKILKIISPDASSLKAAVKQYLIREASRPKSRTNLREAVAYLKPVRKKGMSSKEWDSEQNDWKSLLNIALLHAAMYSAEDTLWLLKNGASANCIVYTQNTDMQNVYNTDFCRVKSYKQEKYTTPLHAAVLKNNKLAQKYLLKYGANPDAYDSGCNLAIPNILRKKK